MSAERLPLDRQGESVRMRANGMGYRAIAAELGVSQSTVYRWCNPDAAAATEKRRRAHKEQWHRENYRGTCGRCGGATSSRSIERCDACDLQDRHDAHEVLLSIVEGMWAAGWTYKEIAEGLGYSCPTGANPHVIELRKLGRAPLRRTPEQAARIRAGRWDREAVAA